MNNEFLAFWDNTVLTMLKNEPEDLTSLASTTADTCSLDDFGFMPDMLNDLILNDCSLAPCDLMQHEAHSSASLSPTTQHVGDDQLPQHASDLCNPTMSTLLNIDLDNGHSDLGLDLSLKNLICEDGIYPLLSDDLLRASARSLSPESNVENNNGRHTLTTEKKQDDKCYSNKDVRSSSSLVKLLKTEVMDCAASRQQHLYSVNGRGAGLMDSSQDFRGSISKTLRQRYNTNFSTNVAEDANVCKTKGVKRPEASVTSAPLSLKRRKQEETAKHGASDSVLMNLLVSGFDVRAGYSCFTSPKPKNATLMASSKLHSSCFCNRGTRLGPAETSKVFNQMSRCPKKRSQDSQTFPLERENKHFKRCKKIC